MIHFYIFWLLPFYYYYCTLNFLCTFLILSHSALIIYSYHTEYLLSIHLFSFYSHKFPLFSFLFAPFSFSEFFLFFFISGGNTTEFLLAFARRNVPIDLVLTAAEKNGLSWEIVDKGENGLEPIYKLFWKLWIQMLFYFYFQFFY